MEWFSRKTSIAGIQITKRTFTAPSCSRSVVIRLSAARSFGETRPNCSAYWSADSSFPVRKEVETCGLCHARRAEFHELNGRS